MPKPFAIGPLAEVAVERDGGRSTLVFVRTLSRSPTAVWAALTEPDQLRCWAPFSADRDLATPGPVVLTMIDGEERVQLPGEVLQATAPSLLVYTWGGDLLRWELVAADDGTRLTLRHTVEDPSWLSRVAAGWHLCLVVGERLLAGDPIPPIVGGEAKKFGWDELEAAYARLVGTSSSG